MSTFPGKKIREMSKGGRERERERISEGRE